MRLLNTSLISVDRLLLAREPVESLLADFDHQEWIHSYKCTTQILLEHGLPFDPAYTERLDDWHRTKSFKREAADRSGMLVDNCASITQSNRKNLMNGLPVVSNVSRKEGYSCKIKLPLSFL